MIMQPLLNWLRSTNSNHFQVCEWWKVTIKAFCDTYRENTTGNFIFFSSLLLPAHLSASPYTIVYQMLLIKLDLRRIRAQLTAVCCSITRKNISEN